MQIASCNKIMQESLAIRCPLAMAHRDLPFIIPTLGVVSDVFSATLEEQK